MILHLKLEAQTLIKNRNSWLHFPVLFLVLGGQGWRSGESTRLPLMWPGFKSRRQRHMWVLSLLLVLSLAPRDFSPGTPAFPCPQKPFSNSNSTRNQVDKEPLCGCATSKSLYIFIYYYIYLFLNLWSRLDFCRFLAPPRRETVRGRSVCSFPEQRLIIEPTSDLLSKAYHELFSQFRWLLCNAVNIWTTPDFREFAFEQLNSFN